MASPQLVPSPSVRPPSSPLWGWHLLGVPGPQCGGWFFWLRVGSEPLKQHNSPRDPPGTSEAALRGGRAPSQLGGGPFTGAAEHGLGGTQRRRCREAEALRSPGPWPWRWPLGAGRQPGRMPQPLSPGRRGGWELSPSPQGGSWLTAPRTAFIHSQVVSGCVGADAEKPWRRAGEAGIQAPLQAGPCGARRVLSERGCRLEPGPLAQDAEPLGLQRRVSGPPLCALWSQLPQGPWLCTAPTLTGLCPLCLISTLAGGLGQGPQCGQLFLPQSMSSSQQAVTECRARREALS